MAWASFPGRAVVLYDPAHTPLSPDAVHVTENGSAVPLDSVTPLTAAHPGDFGVVLVISQSLQMGTGALSEAVVAAKAVAAQRSGNQAIGLIAFDSQPSILLPLTSDPGMIDRVIGTTPWVAPGNSSIPAVALALRQLSAAHVAAGAVVVLSDDGTLGATPAQVAAVDATATALHAQIFAVGIKDPAYSPSTITQLARVLHAKLIQAAPSKLQITLSGIWSELTAGYLVRYRSAARYNSNVSFRAWVDGVPGKLSASYLSPSPPSPPRPKPHTPVPAPPVSAAVATPAAAPQLLPAPSVATPKPAGTFWSSSSSVLAVALVTALLLGVAILLLLRPIKEGVKSRVGDFIVSDDGASADVGIAASGGATVPRILLRRGWWGPYSEDVDAARIRRTPLQLVKLSLGAYVLSMVLGSFALGSPSIMFLAVIPNGALRTLRIVVRRLAKRQRAKFADQLPSHLQDLAGAMRAGRSIVGALASVADGAAEPIRTELERALADERLGLPLEETLQAVADRMASEDMEQVALVAALHRRSGSNVAEALDRVAESARDRADMRREMKALTAQARISGWVLSLLPPTLLVAMALIAPGYAKPMWSTTVGIIALVFSGLLVLAGRFVMSRIVNVEA